MKTKSIKGATKTWGPVSEESVFSIMSSLLRMLNILKLMHWSTMSYSLHKALDELHERLSGHVDKLVESFIGMHGLQPLGSIRMQLAIHSDAKHALEFLQETEDMLRSLRESSAFPSQLQNIVDEMLADINQAVYLARLT